ncbi:MAG: pyridoxamine 5'-phosphate oxidase family protein [Cyclobacteriaceae bacterium]|jgi:nitroimidazol reductase NimA-like FMN-containing flavoprotein (pyridoxamine 5'-phosphate oxidase superfamily)|nr:pyridoxamine 5'-phosphate oxidase family protein [Cyclobacteriaceae bacterium]MDH4296828.1 pyridoxamine 5'-phosphate oxidase family protein [Cyclobacteriaceae bacterium]MDH5251389.1 pyridoxamine 5'-phosphate oxidase family protein [Cyclobacteriaceae bacterium]
MSKFSITEKTEITRLAKRGVYDKETIYAILDEALYCTLAYVRNGQPFQIPTGFCRIEDKLYMHGSVGSFYMRELAEKKLPVCISVTHLDGLVLARSAFHHSVNYRSAVIFSEAEKVTDQEELYKALEVFTNKVQPGRWNDIRKPTASEWKATMLLSFKIEEASAKVRTGPPLDDDEDYALDVWAGVVPIKLERKDPLPDESMKDGISLPPYLK